MSEIRYRRKMELLKTIRTASKLTVQLKAHLETSDQDAWDELLSRRAVAMEQLEEVHGNATEQERESCREELKQLRREDDQLREKSDYVLGMLALEIRESMGMPSYAGHAAGGDGLQACLDTKA